MSVKKTAIGEAQTYGVLPSSWCWARLSDVTSKIVDGTHHTPEYLPDGVPFISVKDIRHGQVHFDDCKFISNAEHSALIKRCHPERGDLLVTKSGTIGRVAIVHTDTPFSLFVSVALLKKTSSNVDSRWTALAFQNWMRTVNVANDVKGSTIKNLHLEDFKSLSIPLAPLNEQRRIVAKIEELFSDLEAGVAALTRAKANLKRYRASVLKAAVEGTLTAEWRTQHPQVEPASKLLERILTERRRQWEADQLAKFAAAGKPPPNNWQAKYAEPSHEVGLFEVPETWTWASTLEVCESVENGNTPPSHEMSQGEGEIPFIKVYNLTKTGKLDFSVNPTFISRAIHDRLLGRSKVLPNDVLMNIVGPPLGKVSLVPDDFSEWNMNQAIVLFRTSKAVMPRFLAACLMCDDVLQWILRTSRATAGQSNISVGNSRLLPIPLPPTSEQAAIVEILDEKLSQIESAEVAIEHSLRRAARLRQSILKQAFEGKLVPQDPTDEPASTLLERIQKSPASNSSRQHFKR